MPKMEFMPGHKIESQKKSLEQSEVEAHAHLVMNNLGLEMEKMRGKKILDLGAGKAELAQSTKNRGINIMSLDSGIGYSADELPKGIDYVKGSAAELPLKNESLDLLLSHGSPPGLSQTKEEVAKIIKEALRVLNNGGEFRFGPGYLHPAIFDSGEIFSEEEEKNFSTEDRMKRIREKSLEFLKTIYPNIEEIAIKGKENRIDGFFYLLRKEEIEKGEKNEDLANADIVEKILVEGSAEELEKLREFHNLEKDKIELWSQFAKLRKATLSEMREKFKERIINNPEPTKEEWQMGVYKEEIEPQVLDAVMLMRKKGYNTFESGFYGPEMQRIGFEEEPLKDLKLPDKIIGLAKQCGLDVKVSSNFIELHYSRFLELDEIKKAWDKIADYLPDLGKTAGSPSNEAVNAFQRRVKNIKKDPSPFLED